MNELVKMSGMASSSSSDKGSIQRHEDDLRDMGFDQSEIEEASWRRVVRLAYLSLAKLHHPDKVHSKGGTGDGDAAAAKGRFQMIQEAFQLLMR